MSSLFQVHEVDEDLRRESIDERRQSAHWHWCETCHGHTGPGSPCAIEPEPEDEDDSEFCPGCSPEPTMDEEDSNTCASCGKALS